MEQAAPTTLVRLREADVVRLCGLAAAARGIELASRHAVGALRRDASRLHGVIAPIASATPSEQSIAVWVELTSDDATPANLRWGCSQHSTPISDGATTTSDQSNRATPAGRLGCEHVAALLATWIRAPADFQTPSPIVEVPTRFADDIPPSPHTPSRAAETVVQPRLLKPPRTPRSSQQPSPTGNTLADELDRLSGDAVLALARRVLGAETTASTEEHAAQEARRRLIATLTNPPLAQALVTRLESGAQVLLTDLLLLGGTITASDLDAYATRAGRAPAAVRADMTILERHALVFPASGPAAFRERDATADAQESPKDPSIPVGPSERRWGDITGWRITPDLRAALPARLPAPSGEPPRGRLERASPRPLLQALALLARAPRPMGVGPTGREHADGVVWETHRQNARIERRGRPIFPLIPGDLPPALLNEAARGANMPQGIVRLARRLLLWAREDSPGQPIADVALLPAEERAVAMRAAFRLWRAVVSPAELADLAGPHAAVRLRLDTSSLAFRPAALAAEAAAGRAFTLNLLARTPPGAWYTLADFLALVWRINPFFLRGRQQAYSSPAWWIERVRDGRPLRPTVYEEWLAAEGVYLRSLIEGPLRWWGALELLSETNSDGAAVAFRLTPFGAYLLADDTATLDADAIQRARAALQGEWGPAALPTRDGALAMQPLTAGAPLLAMLERWARPTSIAGGRLIYTFTPELACTALDEGAQPSELLAAMRTVGDKRTGGRIPERAIVIIGEQLATWRAAYGQAHIETGLALLEARDEATLVEALAFAPEIASRCRYVAPGIALISPADLGALQAILAAKGYHL